MRSYVFGIRRRVGTFILASLFLAVSAGGAFAAVPTFVTNKDNEVGELIQTILNNDWLKNVVYNLQDLKALQDLGDMASQIQEVMNNFDVQNMIGEMTGALSEDFMKAVQEKLQGVDMGNMAKLGDILKNGLGGLGDIQGQLGELANIDLGKILNERGPDAAAKETTERLKGAGEAAIKGTKAEASAGAGRSSNTTSTLPPGMSEDKVFAKEKEDAYFRDGKKYTKKEMEAIWQKEGGGVYRDSNGYTWSTGGNTSSPAGQAQAKAVGSVSEYMENVNSYNPMILPANQGAVAQAAIEMTIGKTQGARDAFLLAMSQEQKNLALEGLASIVAKYTDKEKSYRAAVNTSMEQYKDTLKRAQDVSSKTAPGEALKAIAGLLAVQVEQLNNQNILLLNMTDVMADEIKVLDRLANLTIENYSNSLYNNLRERTAQFEATKQQVRN